MGWGGKGETRSPGWSQPTLGASGTGLDAGSHSGCSQLGGSRVLFSCLHPRQTGRWKSGVREPGSYFPVMRADDRKGNSQCVISCLTLPGFIGAIATVSGTRTGQG